MLSRKSFIRPTINAETLSLPAATRDAQTVAEYHDLQGLHGAI